MKLFYTLLLTTLLFTSCTESQKPIKPKTSHSNMFGLWQVKKLDYKYNGNLRFKSAKDSIDLFDGFMQYKYYFGSDSSFQRRKPNDNISGVENAHGKFSIVDNGKTMLWLVRWTSTNSKSTDTISIGIESLSNDKIVLSEGCGPGNIIQTLEREE